MNAEGQAAEVASSVREGAWAKDDPRRIFVEGTKWWEWQQTGATMFPSDRDRCEREADERYPASALSEVPPTPAQDASADAEPDLRALIERWEYVAVNCRDIADDEPDVMKAAAFRTAAVNRDECAKELRAALTARVPPPEKTPAQDPDDLVARIERHLDDVMSPSKTHRLLGEASTALQRVRVARVPSPAKETV